MFQIQQFDTTVLQAFQKCCDLPRNYESALEITNTQLELSITQRVQLQSLMFVAAFGSPSIFDRVDYELEKRGVKTS